MSDTNTPASSSTPEQPSTEAHGQGSSVDLSVLKSISFGPDWSATPSTEAIVKKVGGRAGKRGDWEARDGGGRSNGGPARRDRRPTRPAPGPAETSAPRDSGAPMAERPRFNSGQPWNGDRGPRRDGPPGRNTPPMFQPTLEVLFYPDDAAFRALTKAVRSSCRTYELFEVAELILQKPERFVVVLKPFPRRDGVIDKVHIAQPDHLPFETEEDAVGHVFDKHLDKFLTVEEIEVEPPKGNFVGVSKCGFTGELIGPPNYHLYPQLMREHHARKLGRMAYEKFASRVELVKEPEQIQAWLDKMKKATRYKLKEAIEGAPEFFESLDAARVYLLAHKKDAIVRGLETARYPGKMMAEFAPGNIKASVDAVLEHQRRFPLDTANNLRGRLRRMKFNLYKKGSKGVSYVCAVKRSFRTPQTVLAEKSQKLISFIEAHPMIPLTKLPQDFLGFPVPETPVVAAAPVTVAPAPAPAVETPAPVAEAAQVEGTTTEAPATETPVAATPAPAPAAPEAPVSPYTPEQQLELREMLMNLRWLVSEGYVTEYGDGKLYAPPVLLPPKPKAATDGAATGEVAAEAHADEIHETADDLGHDEEAAHSEEGDLAAFGDPLNLPGSPETPPAAT